MFTVSNSPTIGNREIRLGQSRYGLNANISKATYHTQFSLEGKHENRKVTFMLRRKVNELTF